MTYLTSRSSGIFILSLLFLFQFSIYDSSGQQNIEPTLISPSTSITTSTHSTSGTLKILGVMVEFQPDTNRFTSVNGTFGPESIPYLNEPGTNIDPLPHNQQYFEAHLEFVKNYFEENSGDQLSIQFEMLSETYILPEKMAEYSPIGVNPDLSKMISFVTDVWTQVGESGTIPVNYSASDNIAFVIFHAGIGRDVELTGTNLIKTPQDLPSFYLSKQSLSNFLDDPAFSGFPIANGNLLVTNTLIVPRTLTRAGIDAVGNQFLLPLSINGLLSAQVGSHLGLPDLFNTETGRSGIGRFGLMDGAGIFSYNGLFPPKLSAWEKSYLGWDIPFLVDTKTESTITLSVNSENQDHSLAKIPLSATEYYLVENRHRDPNGTGVTITIKKNDGTYTDQTFTNRDTDFVNQSTGFDDLLEPGVVVDVSNYDFSLPGGIVSQNDGTERELNGGILIWHIDEGVINSKIEQGGINNNPDRKGVDLEEADGAQDIGIPTSIGLSQNEVNGSSFDFWWSDNNARVISQSDTIQFYTNIFGPDTKPDNRSNSGSITDFELLDFSANQTVANFRIRPVNTYSELYEIWDNQSNLQIHTASDINDTYWQSYPLAAQPIENGWILIPGYNGIQFYDPDEKKIIDSNIDISTLQQPIIQDDLIAIAENPTTVQEILKISTFQLDENKIKKIKDYEVAPNDGFISSTGNQFIDIDGTTFRINLLNDEIIQNNPPTQFSEQFGNYQSRIENGTLIIEYPSGSRTHTINRENQNSRLYTGIVQTSQNKIYVYLLEDGRFSLFSPDDLYQTQSVVYESKEMEWPAIADFNHDGSPDFLFVDRFTNQLLAKNIHGTYLSNFPLSSPQNVKFSGTPLIADLNADDINELIIPGYDQSSVNLYAFDENGKQLDEFPILVGGMKDGNSQLIHPLINGNKLVAVSHFGELKVWEFKHIQNVQWRSKYGNQTNNKVSGDLEKGVSTDPQFSLLNNKETYNWPNPARDETQIRFQTREPAEVRIKVLSMSGYVISDEIYQSKGSVPEEIYLDTSGWASGGYFALIEASANGNKERKLVKIAIAR